MPCPNAAPECLETLDAGLAQITLGLAWHYKKCAKEQTEEDRERYALAQEVARAKKIGLWSDADPAPLSRVLKLLDQVGVLIAGIVGARINGVMKKLSHSLLPRELDRHSGIGQLSIEPSTLRIFR